jgi:multiple sugar transport system permease protein
MNSQSNILAKPFDIGLAILYVILIIVVIAIAFPYFYMLSMALMTESESTAIPARLLPEVPQWQNYAIAFERIDGLRPYINTTIVATGVTFSVLFTSSLAGYGFAKFQFRGSKTRFSHIRDCDS